MPKSSKEKQDAFKENKKKAGYHSYSIWLDAEVSQKIETLKEEAQKAKIQKSNNDIFTEAINSLYEKRKEGKKNASGSEKESSKEDTAINASDQSPGISQNAVTCNPPGEDILLMIKKKIDEGASSKSLENNLIVEWIRVQRDHGMTWDKIAEGLNKAGIPTVSGKRKWNKGRVCYLPKIFPTKSDPA